MAARIPDHFIAGVYGHPQVVEDDEEARLDALQREAHDEDDGVSEMSITTSQFLSTDKMAIASKLNAHITRVCLDAAATTRNGRSLTIEIEAETSDAVASAALRISLQQLYAGKGISWQGNRFLIPWNDLVDEQVRRFRPLFLEAQASIQREQLRAHERENLLIEGHAQRDLQLIDAERRHREQGAELQRAREAAAAAEERARRVEEALMSKAEGVRILKLAADQGHTEAQIYLRLLGME